MKNEFWSDWKRKSKLEEKAIETLIKVKRRILREIPREKIHSIYVKGSFVRREMNEKSDLDIVTIVNDNKYILNVKNLAEKCKPDYPIELGLGALSLWELKNNKRCYKSKKLRGRPYLFIRQLNINKLIYGKKLNKEDYVLKDPKIYLKNRIKTFRDLFIPLYEKKEFGFGELIKQVFWLVEVEQDVLGNNPFETWKKLDKSIKDKNHIIHLTYNYRIHNPIDKKLKNKYLAKLDKYLTQLDKPF
jgi:predicted nucleotidyltransferase